MTRNLSIADYGALASLLSITTLFGLIIGAFIPTLVKFAGQYFANKDYAAARELYVKIFIVSFILGILILVSFTIFSKPIGQFFNIKEYSLIPLVGALSFLGYLFLINSTFVQAKLSFTFFSFLNLTNALTRLLFGVLLVTIGFGLSGALWANLLSTILPYAVSFISLGFLFKTYHQQAKLHIGEVLSYGIPAAIAMSAFSSFVTTDIILVKHFFDPHSAGLYSGISLIGRVIFFFTAPIGTVMFPLVIQKKARAEKHHTIFEAALLMVFCASIVMAVFYFLFPEFTINFFLKNKAYLSGVPYLGLFGLFVTVYSLLFIMVSYFLSIGKTKIVFPVCIGALGQILTILLFHQNFYQVIFDSLIMCGLLFVYLLLYYLRLR